MLVVAGSAGRFEHVFIHFNIRRQTSGPSVFAYGGMTLFKVVAMARPSPNQSGELQTTPCAGTCNFDLGAGNVYTPVIIWWRTIPHTDPANSICLHFCQPNLFYVVLRFASQSTDPHCAYPKSTFRLQIPIVCIRNQLSDCTSPLCVTEMNLFWGVMPQRLVPCGLATPY
jgi:hypothetical protein